ncbi:uncharacterized protein LOC110901798 [Helianthus annuus]|uniref:uncharacterized protein LOC110901798 n=1 Tax=Helianthus annuus TaxID=4232 RepID=UPI000B906E2A|nr:uncharacterized protein LOC110901798 [Helianthus annuus]
MEDDTSPTLTSTQPLSLVTIRNPVPLSSVQLFNQNTTIDPAGVQYPLDLPAVREEIKSFYSEDDPEKRKLPYIQGYPLPRNIEEYLKIKAQQADDISKRDTEGKSDKEIQRNYQYLLSKVRNLEHFSKVFCQKLSEKYDESMRNYYLEYIIAYKKYKAEKYQYKEWTISELQEETVRIQKMIQDNVKQTPPVWANYKKNVTRWREEKVFATYKKLEELRKRDPTAPKMLDYPEAVVPVKQQKLPIRRPTAPHARILYQISKEKQMDELTKEDKAQEDYIIKMVFQTFTEEKQDSAESKL